MLKNVYKWAIICRTTLLYWTVIRCWKGVGWGLGGGWGMRWWGRGKMEWGFGVSDDGVKKGLYNLGVA